MRDDSVGVDEGLEVVAFEESSDLEAPHYVVGGVQVGDVAEVDCEKWLVGFGLVGDEL